MCLSPNKSIVIGITYSRNINTAQKYAYFYSKGCISGYGRGELWDLWICSVDDVDSPQPMSVVLNMTWPLGVLLTLFCLLPTMLRTSAAMMASHVSTTRTKYVRNRLIQGHHREDSSVVNAMCCSDVSQISAKHKWISIGLRTPCRNERELVKENNVRIWFCSCYEHSILRTDGLSRC